MAAIDVGTYWYCTCGMVLTPRANICIRCRKMNKILWSHKWWHKIFVNITAVETKTGAWAFAKTQERELSECWLCKEKHWSEWQEL